ncbi:unnamed protein product, partial [Schistosoma turkestanicum]
ESLGDRISEFGFRIHGSSEGEEEIEDEDDDPEDSGIRDEIIIPNDLSNLNLMNIYSLTSNNNNNNIHTAPINNECGVSPTTLSRSQHTTNTHDHNSSIQCIKSTINNDTNAIIPLMTTNDVSNHHHHHHTENTKIHSTVITTTTTATTTNTTSTTTTCNTDNNITTNNHTNRLLISQKELDLNDIVNSTGHEFYPEKSGE